MSFSDAGEGGLSLYVSGDKVNLGSASRNETATKYVAEGKLPNVTDTRAAALPWAVNGSTAFVNDVNGAVLAWAPWIVDEATRSSTPRWRLGC